MLTESLIRDLEAIIEYGPDISQLTGDVIAHKTMRKAGIDPEAEKKILAARQKKLIRREPRVMGPQKSASKLAAARK